MQGIIFMYKCMFYVLVLEGNLYQDVWKIYIVVDFFFQLIYMFFLNFFEENGIKLNYYFFF